MSSPPAYTQSVPAAGLRAPCSSFQAFPDHSLTGPAPFRDLDGSPVFVCSVLMDGKSVSWRGGHAAATQRRIPLLYPTKSLILTFPSAAGSPGQGYAREGHVQLRRSGEATRGASRRRSLPLRPGGLTRPNLLARTICRAALTSCPLLRRWSGSLRAMGRCAQGCQTVNTGKG